MFPAEPSMNPATVSLGGRVYSGSVTTHHASVTHTSRLTDQDDRVQRQDISDVSQPIRTSRDASAHITW